MRRRRYLHLHLHVYILYITIRILATPHFTPHFEGRLQTGPAERICYAGAGVASARWMTRHSPLTRHSLARHQLAGFARPRSRESESEPGRRPEPEQRSRRKYNGGGGRRGRRIYVICTLSLYSFPLPRPFLQPSCPCPCLEPFRDRPPQPRVPQAPGEIKFCGTCTIATANSSSRIPCNPPPVASSQQPATSPLRPSSTFTTAVLSIQPESDIVTTLGPLWVRVFFHLDLRSRPAP